MTQELARAEHELARSLFQNAASEEEGLELLELGLDTAAKQLIVDHAVASDEPQSLPKGNTSLRTAFHDRTCHIILLVSKILQEVVPLCYMDRLREIANKQVFATIPLPRLSPATNARGVEELLFGNGLALVHMHREGKLLLGFVSNEDDFHTYCFGDEQAEAKWLEKWFLSLEGKLSIGDLRVTVSDLQAYSKTRKGDWVKPGNKTKLQRDNAPPPPLPELEKQRAAKRAHPYVEAEEEDEDDEEGIEKPIVWPPNNVACKHQRKV